MRDDLEAYLRSGACGTKGAAAADRVGAGYALLRRNREQQHLQQTQQQLTRHHSGGRRSLSTTSSAPATTPAPAVPVCSPQSQTGAAGVGVRGGIGLANGQHVALVAAKLKEQQQHQQAGAANGRGGGACVGNGNGFSNPNATTTTAWSEQYHSKSNGES